MRSEKQMLFTKSLINTILSKINFVNDSHWIYITRARARGHTHTHTQTHTRTQACPFLFVYKHAYTDDCSNDSVAYVRLLTQDFHGCFITHQLAAALKGLASVDKKEFLNLSILDLMEMNRMVGSSLGAHAKSA